MGSSPRDGRSKDVWTIEEYYDTQPSGYRSQIDVSGHDGFTIQDLQNVPEVIPHDSMMMARHITSIGLWMITEYIIDEPLTNRDTNIHDLIIQEARQHETCDWESPDWSSAVPPGGEVDDWASDFPYMVQSLEECRYRGIDATSDACGRWIRFDRMALPDSLWNRCVDKLIDLVKDQSQPPERDSAMFHRIRAKIYPDYWRRPELRDQDFVAAVRAIVEDPNPDAIKNTFRKYMSVETLKEMIFASRVYDTVHLHEETGKARPVTYRLDAPVITSQFTGMPTRPQKPAWEKPEKSFTLLTRY